MLLQLRWSRTNSWSTNFLNTKPKGDGHFQFLKSRLQGVKSHKNCDYEAQGSLKLYQQLEHWQSVRISIGYYPDLNIMVAMIQKKRKWIKRLQCCDRMLLQRLRWHRWISWSRGFLTTKVRGVAAASRPMLRAAMNAITGRRRSNIHEVG